MNRNIVSRRWLEWGLAALIALVLFGTQYFTFAPAIFAQSTPILIARGNETDNEANVIVQLIAPNVVRIQPRFGELAHNAEATWVLGPDAHWDRNAPVHVLTESSYTLRSSELTVQIQREPLQITISDANGNVLVQETQFSPDALHFATVKTADEHFYGAQSYQVWEPVDAGMRRDHGSKVWASYQGDSGAPLLFTRRFGLLVDADSGQFVAEGAQVRFERFKQSQLQHFVVVGPPKSILQRVAELTGKPPMFPKWALGFMHSEWGIDEAELRQTVKTYREKNIPLDAVALDFDYKAWGQVGGEFRWNGAEGGAGNKFPSGASGQLAQDLLTQGVRLTGIMKPRVHVQNAAGQRTPAAQWLDQHSCWVAGQKPYIDYFSKLPVRDLDFGKPECREWYWSQAKTLFDSGMAGWWNDEADVTDNTFIFDTFQGANMARAMYDGQRAVSDKRVFTLNRNFYLGAQRYAYGMWSGDIESTFNSMADQRQRMLASQNTGAVKWGMDIGGFTATMPLESENYARWMQFGAFVPIYRVHGYLGQQRQPWAYDAAAEAAAKQAIQLRHQWLPYLYAYEREAYETGIGLVRPLFYEFPDDANVANTTSAWMLGEHILVSPIVGRKQTHVSIYLPPGEWIDYFRGTAYQGGGNIDYAVHSLNDMPVFVRRGAILPNHAPQNYVGERHVEAATIDAFPDVRPTQFGYYDDDGESYAYEGDGYFRQWMHMQARNDEVLFNIDAPQGGYAPALKFYVVKFHGQRAVSVMYNGTDLPQLADEAALTALAGEGWHVGQDQYGPVTWVKVRSGQAAQVRLLNGAAAAMVEPSRVNLARNKPVIASSIEQARYPAHYAVDGDSGTRWSSLKGEQQSIQVDLGARHHVSQIVLNWEAATAADYVIEISDQPDDGWRPLAQINGRNTVGHDEFAVDGVGRHVRLSFSRRATEAGYSLYDFEVYGR
ncbi:MAG: discoidin domain-containing protein [Anaerolineae bacterium]|nr:discoidin domain-containing protein [Anaerolineae bacterium]